MLLINEGKPRGHANIKSCIDRELGVLLWLVRSVCSSFLMALMFMCF